MWIVGDNKVSRRRSSGNLAWSGGSRPGRNSRRSPALARSTDWLVSVNVVNLCPIYAFVYYVGLSNRLEWLSALGKTTILPVWSWVWTAVRANGVLRVIIAAVLLRYSNWSHYVLTVCPLHPFLPLSWLLRSTVTPCASKGISLLLLPVLAERWLPWNNCWCLLSAALCFFNFTRNLNICARVVQSLGTFFYTCCKRITRQLVSGILNTRNSSMTLNRILQKRLNLCVLFFKSLKVLVKPETYFVDPFDGEVDFCFESKFRRFYVFFVWGEWPVGFSFQLFYHGCHLLLQLYHLET